MTDPRVARTRSAVLAATEALLLERGFERVTIDGIAARAGVARSTIYRNWCEPADLLIEATDSLAEMPEPPDLGSLAADLAVMATRLASALETGPLGCVLPSLVSAAERDPALRERLHQLARGRQARCEAVFSRAAARGEITEQDLASRAERFLAPFFARRVLSGLPLDADFCDAQVRAATAR